jgi:hypothetical protein
MSKDFKIQKTQGTCTKTGSTLEPGQEFIALARMGEEAIVREDYSLDAWAEMDADALEASPDVLGIWHTHVPVKAEKKKLLVDNNLLVNFFERLDGQEAPDRIAFRFVLTLILMRKRILRYERTESRDEGVEVWLMKMRGDNQLREVIDPKLDADRIAEVSLSLGEIMEGDFE